MADERSSSTRDPVETANDRFKRGFSDRFWGSLSAAAVIHFVAFTFWPQFTTADVSFTSVELVTFDVPPEVEPPPPPEELVRPATPVVSSVLFDEDVPTPKTTWEANPFDRLRPVPARHGDELSDAPRFTPRTVEPSLRNRSAVEQALKRSYPPTLRDAGIGGSPVVWFFVDEAGRVVRTQLQQSSGYEALDRAALAVADIMEFSPALNGHQRVPVWVALPIVFRAR
jgi:TonB family protein